MKDELKLLQGNYCCIRKNKMLFVTEERGVFVKIDLSTGNTEILEKDVLRNRIAYIVAVGDTIYAVDLGGSWIAETQEDAAEIVYYDLNCHKGNYNNFAYICLYYNKIYLFIRDNIEVVIFDTKTKKIERKEYELKSVPKGFFFDSGCLHKNDVCLFSSRLKKIIKYDLENGKWQWIGEIPITGNVSYALDYQEKLYILSRNTVYDVNDDFRPIASIDNNIFCAKICIVNNIIWFLPGKGTDIYIYSLDTGTYKIYNEYPDDYEYEIKEGWGKFIGNCEDEEYVYWSMRSNNYILKISKKEGNGEWIKPININLPLLKRKSFFEKESLIFEGRCTLEEYIRHIVG